MTNDLLEIYADSFRRNWDLPALGEYGQSVAMTYGDLARRIAATHIFYRLSGIKPGDKVALLGKNSLTWVVTYMATLTYGAVIVPVLAEFSPADATHIINHSGAVLLFVADSIADNLEFDKMPALKAMLSLDSQKAIDERTDGKITRLIETLPRRMRKEYPKGYTPAEVEYPKLPKDSLAEINYTSGTTGFSKGVMLTLDNLAGNVVFGLGSRLHYRGSRCLAFLPLAHAYGCAFDMLTPLAAGTHVTLLGRLPTPGLLLKAFAEIKPSLVICVPLILEKIYRNRLRPILDKPLVKRMIAMPGVRKLVYRKICRSLINAFGGEFEEVIVGGAPLNAEVEEFLHTIKFPFTVGYGMTECGPLISYTPWRQFRLHSAGRTLPNIMHTRIDSPDQEHIPGEILVKGQNAMQGYYKNPKATAEAIDADGWLHTGDMGTRTPDGTIYIKGRYKTMILSANGQNIYPEEIEAKLNNMPYVAESLVVERGRHLVALVYPDYEAMDRDGITSSALTDHMDTVRRQLNTVVAPYEQISSIKLIPNEFEKTPKRSIKRFLYS